MVLSRQPHRDARVVTQHDVTIARERTVVIGEHFLSQTNRDGVGLNGKDVVDRGARRHCTLVIRGIRNGRIGYARGSLRPDRQPCAAYRVAQFDTGFDVTLGGAVRDCRAR